MTDGGVSDPCRSPAEQTHACAGLHVWAGRQARAARTLWLQGEPRQPSETEKLQSTPPVIMPPGWPCFIWKCRWKFPCEHPFYLTEKLWIQLSSCKEIQQQNNLSMDGVCTVCCTWTLQRSVWCHTIQGSQHQKRSKIIYAILSLYENRIFNAIL